MKNGTAVLTACILVIAVSVTTRTTTATANNGAGTNTANNTANTTLNNARSQAGTAAKANTGNIYCEVIPDAPIRDDANNPTKVIAAVRFRCDQPGADAMNLSLTMQKQSTSGAWSDVAKLAIAVRGADTVSTRAETFRSKQVSVACSAGTFRATVTGTSRAGTSAKTYNQIGPRAFDPCRPSIFANKN